MPKIADLTPRSNAIVFADDVVRDVADLLEDLERGQCVALDDAEETEGKARTRARVMIEALVKNHDYTRDDLRTHTVEDGDNYLPAVSLKAS